MNATATKTRIALKNILFATDFSPAAEAALPYAIGLAQRYGGTVHALHVRFPATYPVVGPEAMPQVMQAAEEQAKIEAQQLHQMLTGVPHEVSVGEGEVWPMLNEVATEHKADLIVIGTHGRTGVTRVLLGSVAEEIFRKSTVPVLTVGPHASKDTERRLEMKEILFATDFSPESLAALPFAVSLAQEHQARLTLLHIVGPAKVGELVHAEQYAESIMRQLRKLVPAEAEPWCEPNCKVEHGHEAEKIMEVANALGADLIVLGVRGAEGGIGAATHLLQSIAHKVVTQARCPVLTVRG
ncbi:MAG: universal stress protein [Acidobacteriia bacterium]|nr:universal stress protein [Terriglobia bacterium]